VVGARPLNALDDLELGDVHLHLSAYEIHLTVSFMYLVV
jgi:hypothetical protein